MMRYSFSHVVVLLSTLTCAEAGALDLSRYRILDLSHPYNEQTVYWPTAPFRFQLQQLHYGNTEMGFFYSSYALCTPEHGGTHMDAPIHFHADGRTVDQLPLQQLLLPGVVIDITGKASADRNYRLTLEDVLAFEAEYGTIKKGAAVLVHTGWDRYWPDLKRYLGNDTPGEADNLSFPGFGVDATRFLIEERKAAVIGIDTASIDHGPSDDFIAHRIAAGHNVPGLENLTNLGQLPVRGFTLIALPMKIEGGSGGPVRVIALVEKD